MRTSARARALLVVLTVSGLSVAHIAPAFAANQPASCAVLTTKAVGKNISITASKCLPKSATGGGGTGTATSGTGKLSGKTVITLKWASNHGTTKTAIAFKPAKGNGKCPTGSTRLTITGKVVSSTGAAAKVIKAGQPVTASVCAYNAGAKKGQVLLEKGTVEKL